jgi:hypothetical protein
MKVQDLPNDKLVGVYIELRDRRAQRKAAFANEDAADKSRQESIEGVLLRRFQDDGIESVRTANGTAYKSTQSSATVADWDTFFGFVREREAWELVERRCSKDAVKQYKAANDEQLPPGLNWREEIVINVRR